MKKSLLALPAFLLLAGCNAPADNQSADAPSETPAPDTIEKISTEAKPVQSDNAPQSEKSPDPKYKVINEAHPQMPAGAIAALDKAKVSPPAVAPAAAKRSRVLMATTKGDITIEVNGEAAPLHAKSFLYLAGRGFYNGVTFHRYEPGFVIQGGDPLTKSAEAKEFAGMGGPGYQVPREYNALKHEKFVLSAARSGDPDSAGSQFYFTLDAAPFLDKENSQDGFGYTVYGKVVGGQDVVMKLRVGDKINKATVSGASTTAASKAAN